MGGKNMTQIRQSIFDLSFEKEGAYLVILKCGLKLAYCRRSDIWFDKAKSQFVTLDLLFAVANSELERVLDNIEAISGKEKVDIRYNDISAVINLIRE